MVNSYIIVGVTAGTTLALGAVSGYLFAKRTLEPEYVAIATQEIEEAKEYYSRLYKKDEFANPVELAEALAEDLENVETAIESQIIDDVLESLEYSSDSKMPTPEDIENEALAREIKLAKEHGHPHLLDREEYLRNESGFTQTTLTYFEEDDILVDQDDIVIPEIDDMIGLGQLSRFGVLSGDNNIIYVRNIRQEIEFEVVRNKGNYAKDVLGFIEHADHSRVRKFRREYE
jgi:hypothetical protein